MTRSRPPLPACLLPLCLAAGLLLPAPAAAQSAACPRFAPAKVSLELELAPLRRDFNRSMSQLAAMPGRAPGPAGAAQGHILGLASAKYGERSQVGLLFQPMADGTVCAAVQSLVVDFGFNERIIYVARELPSDSCIHREVLNHEMMHVAADERLLREFTPVARRRLEAALAQARPVRARSQEQAVSAVRRSLDSAMRQVMAEFGRERDRRQARLDTVAEYERVSRSCKGEVNQYLPKGRGRS